MSADVGPIAIRLQEIEKDVNKQEQYVYLQTSDIQGNFKLERIFKKYKKELKTIREQLKDREGRMESMLESEAESLKARVDKLFIMSQQRTTNLLNQEERRQNKEEEDLARAIEKSLRVHSKMINPYCVYI